MPTSRFGNARKLCIELKSGMRFDAGKLVLFDDVKLRLTYYKPKTELMHCFLIRAPGVYFFMQSTSFRSAIAVFIKLQVNMIELVQCWLKFVILCRLY